MGSLAGKSPATTYKSLLKVADETNGVSTSTSIIQDGEGTNTCVSISDDQIAIVPQNDNTTTTMRIRSTSGTQIFSADTSNNVIKVGSTATPANSQLLEFSCYRLIPVAGTHYFIPKSGAGNQFVSVSDMVETSMGTGTDPDTSLDAGATTDDLVPFLWCVPINLTIDSCNFIISTDTDTDTICNVHLYSFDMSYAGDTNDGNLSNGTLLANGQATAVDRNVIKKVNCTIDSANVTANKVIACFVENQTNTDDINIQVQIVYHFN